MHQAVKVFIAVLVTLLTGGIARAQINESDTLRFQLRASFSGNYQTGNVEAITLKGRLDAAFKLPGNFVAKSQNSNLYQEFYSKRADNDIFSRNYLYYKPQAKLYPYAIGYISTNFRRKVNLRYFAGAGATCQVIQTSKHVMKFSCNLVYEQTKFAVNTFNDAYYNGTGKIQAWRATAFVNGWRWLLENHLRLYYDAYWQPALNNSRNYRTQLDIGMDVPVWKGLALNAIYTYAHENVVPAYTKTTDKILTFGFSYAVKSRNK